MPAWLTDTEYPVLTAVCARLVPADECPGAVEAGVVEYIDGFLGAFSFDPPRIWAGGPTSGRHGGEAGFARFHSLSAIDELAWRIRIEGSLGMPEREFNGPVIGLQERYRAGLAALGADFCDVSAEEQDAPAAGPRGVHRARVRALLRRHLRAPEYGGNRDWPGGRSPSSKATSNPGATAMRRCRDHDRRRHHRGFGPGRIDRGRRPHPGGLDGDHHREGPQPPSRSRQPGGAGDGLLQRRAQVHLNRHFLGPDPIIEPRTFRLGPEDGDRRYVGEVNSIPSTVGGGGTHADGKVPRFREEDFVLHSTHGPIDGADVADWPLTYDDLEPFYAQVEGLIGVSGEAGANPFAAWRSGPYPMPPGAPMYGATLSTRRGREARAASLPGTDGGQLGAL